MTDDYKVNPAAGKHETERMRGRLFAAEADVVSDMNSVFRETRRPQLALAEATDPLASAHYLKRRATISGQESWSEAATGLGKVPMFSLTDADNVSMLDSTPSSRG